jgi:hypothetical protein
MEIGWRSLIILMSGYGLIMSLSVTRLASVIDARHYIMRSVCLRKYCFFKQKLSSD